MLETLAETLLCRIQETELCCFWDPGVSNMQENQGGM